MPGVRRALITGATGYIGSNLVRHLLALGWQVDVVVRPDATLDVLAAHSNHIAVHVHDGSTSGMLEIVATARPDIVFHLASLFLAQHTPDDVERLITSNLLFSSQLAEAMRANRVECLVNAGTSWQHFEDEPYNPVNLYAATKQACEDILAYYVHAFGLKLTTLALFDTYGPGDWRRKLLPLLLESARDEQRLEMSPGEQEIDLVHVDDVVRCFRMAGERLISSPRASCEVFGVGSGRPVRLHELVALIERIVGRRLDVAWGAKAYRPREVMRAWKSYRTLPGWSADIPLEVGLRATVHR